MILKIILAVIVLTALVFVAVFAWTCWSIAKISDEREKEEKS